MSNLIGLSAYNEQHSFEKRKFWQHNSLEYLQLRYSEIFYLWCYQWFACCQIPEWCYWTHERITRLESTPKIVLRPLMVKAFHYSTMTWHKWKTYLNPLYKLHTYGIYYAFSCCLQLLQCHPLLSLSVFRKKIENIPQQKRHRLLRLLKPRSFIFPYSFFNSTFILSYTKSISSGGCFHDFLG